MGIGAEEVEGLVGAGKLFVDGNAEGRIASAKFAAGEVDAD